MLFYVSPKTIILLVIMKFVSFMIIVVSHSYLFSHENSKSHCSEKDRIGRHIVIVLASGTLKLVVNYPKVMCKLFSADSFTIDANSLSNFHQVWGTDNICK